LLSNEHFTVDSTLIEAWASHNSFQAKDGKPPENGKAAVASVGSVARSAATTRTNRQRIRTRDCTARAATKARTCVLGYVMTENGNGLIVDTRFSQADGFAGRAAEVDMVASRPSRKSDHAGRG
jgi:hypothetical protein